MMPENAIKPPDGAVGKVSTADLKSLKAKLAYQVAAGQEISLTEEEAEALIKALIDQLEKLESDNKVLVVELEYLAEAMGLEVADNEAMLAWIDDARRSMEAA